MVDKTAVLLMAYGTPSSLEEVEPYFADIRGGRKPSPESLRELVARYERVGGQTPLLEITRRQARALQEQLGDGFRVYIGMKHWHPYIAQAVGEIIRDRLQHVIAIAMAPHHSHFTIKGYGQRLYDAIHTLNADLDVKIVESWNDHPLFLQAVAANMEQARQRFVRPAWQDIQVDFSAHSLPERVLQSNDPYPQELRETCEGVAARVGLEHWRFAYQSAGRTEEKWLGPGILATLDEIAVEAAHTKHSGREESRHGPTQVLIAPIGFVADHLEVLYDIDIECSEHARELGLDLRRIESPNASPMFIAALAAIVRENERGGQ